MSLITANTATNLAAFFSNYAGDPIPTVLSGLSDILDTEFQKAIVSQPSVDITVVAGTLSIPRVPGNESTTPDLIGNACATYWSNAVGHGTPQTLSNIKSVVNDANKIASKIAANIRGIINSSTPTPYLDFVDAIYKEVLLINWTVVEESPPTIGPNVIVTIS